MADTKSYLLRDIDADLWRRMRQRTAADHLSIQRTLVMLIAAYADGRVTIGVTQQTPFIAPAEVPTLDLETEPAADDVDLARAIEATRAVFERTHR